MVSSPGTSVLSELKNRTDARHHRTLVEFEKLLWIVNIPPKTQECYAFLYAEAFEMMALAEENGDVEIFRTFAFQREWIEDNLILSASKQGFRSEQLKEAIQAERSQAIRGSAYVSGASPQAQQVHGTNGNGHAPIPAGPSL